MIKIQTKKNSDVRLPFDGVVAAIQTKDYLGSIIYIDHGDQYYTIYANLNENIPKSLNIGEYYYKDTVIGSVSDSEDGKHGELNFGIWKISENGEIIEWSKKGNEVFCIAEFEKTIQIMGKIDDNVSALKYGQMIKLTKCLLDDKHRFFFSLTNK